jgi:hypothetical protein
MWVIWNLISVRLETDLVSLWDRCIVCAKRLCLEIVLDAPDGPPRWWLSTRSSFRSVWRWLILTQDRCTVYGESTMARKNRFGHTRWNSSVTWVLWNFGSVCLETVLVSVQDRCMLCTKCIIGSEIVLDTPDGTPRLRGSTRSSFRSIWK